MSYPLRRQLSVQLDTADADGLFVEDIAGAGDYTLDGALTSDDVATFDTPRRVLLASAGNDSAITFTITGTGRQGRAQSETLVGSNAGSVYSLLDYLTVTNIASSGNASSVTAGTNAVGSSETHILDPRTSHMVYVDAPTGEDFRVEVSADDLSPAWDMANTDIVWHYYEPADFASDDLGNGQTRYRLLIPAPATMIRLTNLSGTGTKTLTVISELP